MNTRKRPQRKIWFVAHPISQYKEDVKLLAMQNNLKIVDAKFSGEYPEEMVAAKAPKITSTTKEVAVKEAAVVQATKDDAERKEIARKTRMEIEVRAQVEKELKAK